MVIIFLAIAVSLATCEKNISKVKLIKNYLRFTMSSLRLKNIAILSIERHLIDEMVFNCIDFASFIKLTIHNKLPGAT